MWLDSTIVCVFSCRIADVANLDAARPRKGVCFTIFAGVIGTGCVETTLLISAAELLLEILKLEAANRSRKADELSDISDASAEVGAGAGA